MKLGDIYKLCKKNYDKIEGCGIEWRDNRKQPYFVRNSRSVLNACKELEELSYFKGSAIELRKSIQEAMLYEKSSRFDVELANEIEDKRDRLKALLKCIIDMYEEMGIQPKEIIGMDIKFPVTGNFSDFRKSIDELDFVFTKCPFFQDENEKLQFDSVDVGSFWMTFAVVGSVIVGGSVLLNNIAAFIDKCIILRSHYLTTEKQKIEIEKSKIEQKEKEIYVSRLDDIYKIMVDNAISELEEITKCVLKDGEERGRVEQSIEKVGKLIDKGMQIYATIDSPEETKVLFEPLQMHYLDVSSKLKLLEDKKEE